MRGYVIKDSVLGAAVGRPQSVCWLLTAGLAASAHAVREVKIAPFFL